MKNYRLFFRKSILKGIWIGVTLAVLHLLSACCKMHDPVLHAYGKVALKVQVDIGAEMEALGYTVPESYHIDFYDDDGEGWLNERNMMGNSTNLYLNYGWYHMLFYNNDTQLLRLQYGEEKHSLEATTEKYPYISLPDTLKQKLDVRQMPDLLYATYDKNIHVSDDLADYTYLPEQNAYVLEVEAKVKPLVYIYQIEVKLLHNSGQVIGCENLTMTGLASSVDIFQAIRGGSEVAHQVPTTFTNGGQGTSLVQGQLQTFGQYNADGQKGQNLCYVSLNYANGGKRCIPVDVTQQMQEQPKGGYIKIVLDLDTIPAPKPTDGWHMEVNGWDEENHYQGI